MTAPTVPDYVHEVKDYTNGAIDTCQTIRRIVASSLRPGAPESEVQHTNRVLESVLGLVDGLERSFADIQKIAGGE